MDNIIMLFLCLSIGVALRAFGRMPENGHTALNAFIINVALPALTLSEIHKVSLSPSLFYAVLMPWLLFAVSAVLFAIIGKALALRPSTVGALAVVAGLGNTSFVGIPMIQAFYGANGASVGILIDQLGTYLVLSTLGIVLICVYSGSDLSWRDVGWRIATFPPLIALALALALLPVEYPTWASNVLARLGGTLAPLALVSVGSQLRLSAFRGNAAPLAMGLGYKLVLGPALIAAVYLVLMHLGGQTTQITLFEAAMAPQIGGSIVAMQYGLDAGLITLLVGVGTVLSFVTVPAWYYLLAFG